MKRLKPSITRQHSSYSSKSPTTSEQQANMHGDVTLFFNINSDPGATTTQKSFANDIMRNESSPGVTDRRGSPNTRKKFQLYEKQCLRVAIGASAKAQTNRHLSGVSARNYGPTSGARTIPPSKKPVDRKQGKSSTRSKAHAQHESSLMPEGSFLKGKGKEGAAKPKKQMRFETAIESESLGFRV